MSAVRFSHVRVVLDDTRPGNREAWIFQREDGRRCYVSLKRIQAIEGDPAYERMLKGDCEAALHLQQFGPRAPGEVEIDWGAAPWSDRVPGWARSAEGP